MGYKLFGIAATGGDIYYRRKHSTRVSANVNLTAAERNTTSGLLLARATMTQQIL
jgi:hypothetical protein